MASPASKISVALVITGLAPGGAERAITRLALGLLGDEQFSVEVYSLMPRSEAGHDLLVQQLEQAQIPVHFLGARSAWGWFSVERQLAKLFQRQRPDVVQSYLMHANVLGSRAARRAQIPVVVTGLRVAERRARWRLWVERWGVQHAMRHVAVSESVAEFARTQEHLAADRVLVIPNGVDVEHFRQALPANLAELGIPAGRRVVVCVGRLDRQKGLDWLLAAAPRWLGELPEHDLLLVGQGPERGPLERQAASLGIAPRVHFAGWRGEVAGILKASDLLVLPSAWEGMPNVLLEAMAAGLPVVARLVEGVREVLGSEPATASSSRSASLQAVSENDPEAFSNQVVAILKQPELRAQLGAENQRRAAENFRWENTIGRYAELYRALLQPPRAER